MILTNNFSHRTNQFIGKTIVRYFTTFCRVKFNDVGFIEETDSTQFKFKFAINCYKLNTMLFEVFLILNCAKYVSVVAHLFAVCLPIGSISAFPLSDLTKSTKKCVFKYNFSFYRNLEH